MTEAAPLMIGDSNHIAFEIVWPDQEPAEVRGLGWGGLTMWFAGCAVWALGGTPRRRATASALAGAFNGRPQAQSVTWTWIDLVEHLARSWWHLLYEEIYPFGLVAVGPEALRTRTLLTSVPGKTAIEVEDAVHAFQHRHDLAAGLNGIVLPPIWLVREGPLMRIRAEEQDLWRPCDEVLTTLTRFVDAVRARTVAPVARAKAAFERWDARELHKLTGPDGTVCSKDTAPPRRYERVMPRSSR